MDLLNDDMVTLLGLMDSGQLKAADLCKGYLDRIETLDGDLNAVIEVNQHVLEEAAAADRTRSEGRSLGPLHGIPLLIKDNIDSGDGMMTTAGSLALDGHRAETDAFVLARLRAAGALIIGKANMSEWAFFRDPAGCSGWSSRGGQVRNPHVLDRSPSGSSSGSGAGVAAGFCAAALGTETDGSVVSPSASNGICGLKPTIGLVSRQGVIPISATQDTAGPMAKSVRDLALLLEIMTGSDPNDPVTEKADRLSAYGYRQFIGAPLPRDLRLGVATDLCGQHGPTDSVFEAALARWRELGAELIEVEGLCPNEELLEAEMTLLFHEFKAGINDYLRSHPGTGRKDLADIIDFNQRNAERVMSHFGQRDLETAEATEGLDAPAYREARALCRRLAKAEGIDRILRENNLAAILAPTKAMPPALIDPVLGDRQLLSASGFPAMAGTPHITLPMGFVRDLPVGLSIMAGAFQEGLLLTLASAFEKAHPARRAPSFISTL